MRVVVFRFYEELNDFLPLARKKVSFEYAFRGSPSVKDAVEAIGVPHTEVDLVIVNGRSVGFEYQLRDGDRIAVYPTFEALDISPATRLKARPLRKLRFIADVHLGKLARLLRMMGFDTLYDRDFEDAEIVARSTGELRIILLASACYQIIKLSTANSDKCHYHGFRMGPNSDIRSSMLLR